MRDECPRCHGSGSAGVNGLGERMPCYLCHGQKTISPSQAITYAVQHPGSALWRKYVLPTLAKGGPR